MRARSAVPLGSRRATARHPIALSRHSDTAPSARLSTRRTLRAVHAPRSSATPTTSAPSPSSASKRPKPSTTPTRTASSTATSSRPTCWSSVVISLREMRHAKIHHAERDGDTRKLWITDFGLARIEADAGMTMTGDILGTLRYMSPEQALGQARTSSTTAATSIRSASRSTSCSRCSPPLPATIARSSCGKSPSKSRARRGRSTPASRRTWKRSSSRRSKRSRPTATPRPRTWRTTCAAFLEHRPIVAQQASLMDTPRGNGSRRHPAAVVGSHTASARHDVRFRMSAASDRRLPARDDPTASRPAAPGAGPRIGRRDAHQSCFHLGGRQHGHLRNPAAVPQNALWQSISNWPTTRPTAIRAAPTRRWPTSGSPTSRHHLGNFRRGNRLAANSRGDLPGAGGADTERCPARSEQLVRCYRKLAGSLQRTDRNWPKPSTRPILAFSMAERLVDQKAPRGNCTGNWPGCSTVARSC